MGICANVLSFQLRIRGGGGGVLLSDWKGTGIYGRLQTIDIDNFKVNVVDHWDSG